MVDLKFLNALKSETQEEVYRLLKWWKDNMVDPQAGGFLGEMDGNNQVQVAADKGIILNTRLLWSFSMGATYIPSAEFEALANRAFDYLVNHFWDQDKGGFFWLLDHQGKPIKQKKQVYAQAFGIYAMSEHYRLTNNPQSKQMALELFQLIERHSLDKENNGYWEAFDRDWGPLDDLRLGEHDQNDPKTMNTHLHILEAYTNLYSIHPEKEVRLALVNLVRLFLDRFIDKSTHHLHLFFDDQWGLKSSDVSFGHDIEASWLIWEAIMLLNDQALQEEAMPVVLRMAEVAAKEGLASDGAMMNERKADNTLDTDRIWWVQAEAMVGFVNAYELSGDPQYLEYLRGIWSFIKNRIRDEVGGEWHWGRREDGSLMPAREKAGPWKAPYHNARAMMECSSRMESIVHKLAVNK